MLTRRQFLYLSSVFLFGCSHAGFSKHFIVSDSVDVSNLYFYNLSDSLNKNNLEQITKEVKKNFEDVGINIKNNTLVRNLDYPKLDNLDVLILLSDNDFGLNPVNIFGIKNSEDIGNLYSAMKEEIKFPYNELTAECNIGIVSVESTLNEINRLMNLFSDPLDDKQKTRYLTNLCTHEIAHGYGAAHIKGDVLDSYLSRYFMYSLDINDISLYPNRFHPENILKMKKFIRNVKDSNLTKEEIISLRHKSIKEYVNVF